MTMNQSFAEQVRSPGVLSPEEMTKVQSLYENILLQTDTTNSHTIAARIPRTYAEALLAAATARNEVVAVAESYHSLVTEIFPAVPGLELYLGSVAVTRKVKDEFLVRTFEGKTVPLFLDFLRLLNRKERLGMLRLIGLAFRTILENRANRERVLVEAAAPLTDDQKAKLAATLAAALNKTPVLVVRVNPELLGGLVVHVGDKVFDTSVRTKLVTVRNQLLARGTHEIQSRRDRFSHS